MSERSVTQIADALERVVDAFPDEIAITQGDRELSYREFDDLAARLAGFLAEQGVGKDDRVAIGVRNSPEYLITLFAAAKLRAVAVNVNYRYRSGELAYVLEDSGARALVFDEALAGAISELDSNAPDCRLWLAVGADAQTVREDTIDIARAYGAEAFPRVPRGDDTWLLYTGGTTGLPKGVQRTHSSVMGLVTPQAFLLLDYPMPVTDSEWIVALDEIHPIALRMMIASPLMHGTGQYNSLMALVTGGRVILLPPGSFDAAVLCAELGRSGATDLSIVGDVLGVPIADELERAAEEGRPYDLSALRRIQSTGTVWSAAVKARLLAQADVQLFDVIAATEGGPYAMCIVDRSTPTAGLTDFRLAPRARLIGENGADVQAGSDQVGQLAAVASTMAYVGDADKSVNTWPVIDGVRYSVPGDLARLNADGTLAFLGRASGVINTGGEKVHPAEVEDALRGHPAVADAVVVGVPHPRWGHQVAAIVECREVDVQPGELVAHVRGLLAAYKVPRVILIEPELRRGTTGKVDIRWAKHHLETTVADRT